jgi:hypothetical protein
MLVYLTDVRAQPAARCWRRSRPFLPAWRPPREREGHCRRPFHLAGQTAPRISATHSRRERFQLMNFGEQSHHTLVQARYFSAKCHFRQGDLVPRWPPRSLRNRARGWRRDVVHAAGPAWRRGSA